VRPAAAKIHNFPRMKSFPSLLMIMVVLIASCNPASRETQQATHNPAVPPVAIRDTTPKVTGIGGIFFTSADPQAISAWYGENLGLAIDEYGSPFEFRNANDPGQINYLRWSPHAAGTDYFAPSEKPFMINYRVQNLEGLVSKLRQNGVRIVDTIETVPYGKFVHIMDPDGNKIELWEPVDSVLTQMGTPTTK
jgi:predicted enzyme related to lactoylglutathione lyase